SEKPTEGAGAAGGLSGGVAGRLLGPGDQRQELVARPDGPHHRLADTLQVPGVRGDRRPVGSGLGRAFLRPPVGLEAAEAVSALAYLLLDPDRLFQNARAH